MSPFSLPSPKGFKAGGIHCGLKKRKKDLALIYSEVPAAAAGVFTTNRVQAAPVKLTRNTIANGTIQAIIINSGNANAATGPQGERGALEMARATAEGLGIDIAKVAVASTGPIGKPFPTKLVVEGIEKLVSKIKPDSFSAAAQAILTSDTVTKGISRKVSLGNTEITITAIAKGAGMIQPKMATMLCFICTDLAISQPLFQQILKNSINKSFNCITVDGCTSTSDMVIGMANAMAGNPKIESPCNELVQIQEEFDLITKTLAQMIVRDGEGATKLIHVQVTGAHSEEDARIAAFNIANSNLLKSSFFGESLNWGRIMSAVGSSGIKLEPDYINVYLGDVLLVNNGQSAQFSTINTSRILKQKEINLRVELNQGLAQATVWTSDLSPKYVRINMR